MIRKLLLNTNMIWMIFIEIFKNTFRIRKKKLIVFDDMIAFLLNNKSLNPTVIELFVTRRKLNISLVLLHNLTSLFQKILK